MSAAAQVIDIDSAESKGGKKSKKKLIIIAALVLLLGGGGGGGWFWWQQKNADHGDPAAAKAKEAAEKAAHAAPPTFLPMEALVVNLAGRDGERLVQIGITLQLADAKTAELVKAHMPTIRSGVLLTVARHTAEELLLPEGKEALAMEVMRQVTEPLGLSAEPAAEHGAPAAKDDKAPKADKHGDAPANPVQKVLFSSLIIQ
jgi:flagellar FliL protein